AHLSRQCSDPEADRPDLVLLDLNLPKVNGLEILRYIRSSPELGHVPVIVLSASESPKDKEAVSALGATSILMKPSDLSGLHRMGRSIRDVLDRVYVGQTAD